MKIVHNLILNNYLLFEYILIFFFHFFKNVISLMLLVYEKSSGFGVKLNVVVLLFPLSILALFIIFFEFKLKTY